MSGWRVALGAVLVLGLVGSAIIVRELAPKPRRPPPFALTEARSGAPFTEASLLGKPSALFFGFTSCPDVCPTTLTSASRVLSALGEDAAKLRFVFVSVDPENDTVERMATYLSAFNARILGVTGTQEEIDKIVRAFHVVVKKQPSGLIDHTALVLLLDRTGELIGTLDLHDEPEDTSVAKLRELIAR